MIMRQFCETEPELYVEINDERIGLQLRLAHEKLGCVMLPLPMLDLSRVKIDPADLHEKGRESWPHVTVLYGLREKPDDLAFGKVSMTIGKLSSFRGDDFDVLKFDVQGDRLREINVQLRELPHESEHKAYRPHVTVAYLKPGRAWKYVGSTMWEGRRVLAERVVYSSGDKKQTALALAWNPEQPRDSFGRFGEAPDYGGSFGSRPRIKEQKMFPRTKSEIAKSSVGILVDKDVQRYSEEKNEPYLAAALGGVALDDNEPVDVLLDGHGVELKTMVANKSMKITMKSDAIERKQRWERSNHSKFHTVVFDDTKVYDAKGPGKHDTSQRVMYYRRGYGSFRVQGMHVVKNIKELKRLLELPNKKLPEAARK